MTESQHDAVSFLGLPVPDFDEATTLSQEHVLGFEGEGDNFYVIANRVLNGNPMMGSIIQHDVRQWLEYDAHDDFSDSERIEYADGITDGYEYFIGFVTRARFLRSDSSDFSEFLTNAAEEGHVPLIGKREQARIKEVRAGNALIDEHVHDYHRHTSTDLAYLDTAGYIFEAARLGELLDDEAEWFRQQIEPDYQELDPDGNEQPVEAHTAGFYHGVSNAVEMYLQAQEMRVLLSI